MQYLAQILMALVMITLSSFSNAQCGAPAPMLCDIDGDRDVDVNDIKALTLAKGTPISGPGDIRDMDGDGMITVLDARQCVAFCTGGNCAVSDRNQPPVPTVQSNSSVLSLAKVTLDGSLSGDPDGQIVLYAWAQVEGPQVDVESASDPIAYFNAPSVSTSTSLRFKLQVKDDKGASSSEEVAIEVLPIDDAQLQVEFVALKYLKPNNNLEAHADYYAVEGPPIANEEILVVATLSGLIKDVSFEMRDMADNVIGLPALTRTDNSADPPFDFGGVVTIPDEQFSIAAIGETQDGQSFDLTFPTPFVPAHFRVLFTPSLIELKAGEQRPVTLLIENGGQTDTFKVEFYDPSGLLQNAYDTSLEIAAGDTSELPVVIVAPQGAQLENPISLDVYVTAQGVTKSQLGAELLLSVEAEEAAP